MLNTVLLIIILVGYCSGKHTANYGTIGAYEAFVVCNDVIMIVIPFFIIISTFSLILKLDKRETRES